MDLLKKVFPLSFAAKKDVTALVINLLIHLVAVIIGSLVLGLAGDIAGIINIPVISDLIGWVLRVVGTVIDAYCLVGGVLSVLDYLKVLK